jgi:hypothetical protein
VKYQRFADLPVWKTAIGLVAGVFAQRLAFLCIPRLDRQRTLDAPFS